MRYGVLLLGDRVAPRCSVSDGLLLASTRGERLRSWRRLAIGEHDGRDLHGLLEKYGVEVLVCGGIRRDLKQAMLLQDVHVVDNVAATADEVVAALDEGVLHSGLRRSGAGDRRGYGGSVPTTSATTTDEAESEATEELGIDCLSCRSRACLRGRPCDLSSNDSPRRQAADEQRMMDAAMDISAEEDRILCRIAELVYYCLEMGYQRIGIAFCIEMTAQTEVLVGLLRRFFDVFPVCCKVGGVLHEEESGLGSEQDRFQRVACNPHGQASVLNDAETDLNVMVGLCMGMDCLFARASEAPVTSLFVRDRSLANNPVAALYSEYHLGEVTRVPATHGPLTAQGER